MKAKPTLSPAQVERRLLIEAAASAALYLIVTFGSVEALKLLDLPPAARVVVALAPVVPIVLMMWTYFRYIMRVDELQRRISTESLAIAGGGTAFLGLTYFLLEGSAGFPPLPEWWIWVSVCLIWGIGSCVLRRRYR